MEQVHVSITGGIGGGGNMPKNDLKVSQMEKICLQCTNLDETGREAWYENEA